MSHPPLRILHLTAGSDAGGLSQYIYNLCSAMHQQGHHVAVAGERGAWHWLFKKAPWPWIDMPLKGGPLGLWRAARALSRYLDDHPVDILHAHYRKAALVARHVQRNSRPRILFTLHLSHISLAGAARWLSDFGDHTHVASADAQRWLMDTAAVPSERIALIPHGIVPEQYPEPDTQARIAARESLGLPLDARVAAYVGRLDVPKNEDWLIDLAVAGRSALPDLHILMAGEGPHESRLHRRIARLQLEGCVHLLGHRQPLPVLHAADALLLPSTREGFSLVCAEAMSCGLPVLRTRTSGTTELILENVTGRSTPIDHDAFITAALDFLRDKDALVRMGRAAARHVRQNFTFDRQLEQTVSLYRKLAEVR